ncbi:zinc finger BED domain-containing protein 4-like [Vanacampus margaritifer]
MASSTENMDQPRKRKLSPVWDHFNLTTENKVKCRLCSQELSYINRSTSSMLRHYRARHEKDETETPVNSPVMNSGASRKQAVDQAIVSMIIKDCQPLSIVEDEGFRDLLQLLEPSYVLPTRKAIKNMVSHKYEEQKEKVKEELQSAVAVSLTADMWTSINMESYLAVTCHYIDTENHVLRTSVLGVQHFPQHHTAKNMAQVKKNLMEEWAIAGKVRCLVTDAAENMIACAKKLQMRHYICIAHSLNLTVRKSYDQIETLSNIRNKTRQIVTFFRTSTTAKEKLAQVQQQMGKPVVKLINEVPTRWNSTYHMLERLTEQKEPVVVALASVTNDTAPLTAEDFNIIEETIRVLAPFNHATVELSEEKRVSGSKVIPMLKMLHCSLQRNALNVTTDTAIRLVENLNRRVVDHLCNLESLSITTLATLLDPRYKTVGFLSSSRANEAVKRLKAECAAEMRSPESTQTAPEEAQPGPSTPRPDDDLWQQLDAEVLENRANTNVTNDAIIEVQRYLSENNTQRTQDPLQYWQTQRLNYPNLYKLAMKCLCTPSSSVPCERVFSKAGEIVSKRRNRLRPNMLKKLMFLNKNV